MLSHINNNEPGTQRPDNIRILYTTRLPQHEKTTEQGLDQILFLPRLRQMVQSQKTHQSRVSLDLFLTNLQPSADLLSAPSDIVIHSSRIRDGDLQSAIGNRDSDPSSKDTVCYVCGPPAMTDSIVERLKGMLGEGGEKRVFFEKWW